MLKAGTNDGQLVQMSYAHVVIFPFRRVILTSQLPNFGMLLEKEMPDKLCSSLCSEDLFQRVPFPPKNVFFFTVHGKAQTHIQGGNGGT